MTRINWPELPPQENKFWYTLYRMGLDHLPEKRFRLTDRCEIQIFPEVKLHWDFSHHHLSPQIQQPQTVEVTIIFRMLWNGESSDSDVRFTTHRVTEEAYIPHDHIRRLNKQGFSDEQQQKLMTQVARAYALATSDGDRIVGALRATNAPSQHPGLLSRAASRIKRIFG